MIVFNLTHEAAEILPVTLSSNIAYLPTMNWYAHHVLINQSQCIIAMEERTRYAMVFCGMTDETLQQFPEMFAERLWREVFSICNHVDEAAMNTLMERVKGLRDQVCFQRGFDKSVLSHIHQVAVDLREQVEVRKRALPVEPMAAFSYGIVRVNKVLRQRTATKEYFVPIDEFESLCMNLVKLPRSRTEPVVGIEPDEPAFASEKTIELELRPIENAVAGNVIRVNFERR